MKMCLKALEKAGWSWHNIFSICFISQEIGLAISQLKSAVSVSESLVQTKIAQQKWHYKQQKQQQQQKTTIKWQK